jgi:hypothetical protein
MLDKISYAGLKYFYWREGAAMLFLHGYSIDFWRSLRPNDRTDIYIGDRPIARLTDDVFLMLQTSL